MEKSPTYVKIIAVLGVLAGILGLIMAFKVPGTLALAPLVIGLVFGLTAFLISKSKKAKCLGSWVALILSGIGIIVTLAFQTKEPEVAVDIKQEETIEQTNEDITESDELDEALDELEVE